MPGGIIMDYMTRKEKCTVCETVFEGSSEQPVDLELSLPDYCPDVERILKCRICPGISAGSITGDRLDVDGNVTIRLYYLDSKKQAIRLCEHTSPFSCSFTLRNADPECISRIRLRTGYLNCRAVSPRKLDIHGAFTVMASVYKPGEKQYCTGIEGDDIQQQTHSEEVSELKGCARQQFSLSEVLDIGKGKGTPEGILRSELTQIRDKYKRPRRTEIIQAEAAVFTVREDEEDRDLLFVMDRFGYAKTMEPGFFSRNEAAARENYRFCFPCRSSGRICLFTKEGQLYTLKTADLPAGRMRDKGIPVDNISNYDSSREEILYAASQEALRLDKVVFVTQSGMVKAVPGTEFDVIKKTVAATKLAPDDRVVLAAAIGDASSIVLQSRNGMFLRFSVEELPEQKKNAIGARGIRLAEGDLVENAWLLSQGDKTVAEMHDVQIDLTRLRISRRDGKGTKRF